MLGQTLLSPGPEAGPELRDNPDRKRRREKLRKQLSWLYRMAREIELATRLKVRRAIPPLYPGMYLPSRLMEELSAAGRKAIDALSLIRDALERYEATGIDIERARIASLLETVKDSRDEFSRIIKIAYTMKDREEERIKRGREKLAQLELLGAPDREIVETRAAMREAEIGSRQYTEVINAGRLITNIVGEGLEAMRESIEAIGLRIPE